MPHRSVMALIALTLGCLTPNLSAQVEPQGFLGVKLENHYVTDGSVLVRISEVIAKGPAEKAGLRVGDVIVNVGNVHAKDREVIIETIKSFKPGDRVTIVVSREEKELSLFAVLAKREDP